MDKTPTTVKELFDFYHEFVKPLYSAVQLQNALPAEVLFEINAAFDHLSRHWQYGETEQAVVEKAYSHLKRSCLDIFKLAVKQAGDQFRELRTIDTSVIDNGAFDCGLIALWTKIKSGATIARQQEGNVRQEDKEVIKAFDAWSPVYADCVAIEKVYYTHPKLPWAIKRQGRGKWTERLIGFALGVLASIIATIILGWISIDAWQRLSARNTALHRVMAIVCTGCRQ